MVLVQSGKVCSFEVTFDSPSLSVAMSVYDDSGASPTLVQGPSAMVNVVGNMYRAKFTPSANKTYLIFKAVYTSGAFTTLDSTYLSGSESIRSENLLGVGSVKINTALPAFTFLMLTTTGSPATGLTVTATRAIDGAAFAACANAVSEISNGFYKIDLAAADLNGDVIALKFTATGANMTGFTILTED